MSSLNSLASSTYIITNSSTTITYNPVGRADIINRQVEVPYSTSTVITAAQVVVSQTNSKVPSNHVTNPGVFTEGTVKEGTLSNPTNDSNS
jgi:hypothetical protein